MLIKLAWMQGIDWTALVKNYKGQWVALGPDEKTVLASGKTARVAWEKAIDQGHRKPILANIPEKIEPYVGYQL